MENNYTEYNLAYGYSIRQSDEYNALFKDNEIQVVLDHSNNRAYNRIYDFSPRLVFARNRKDKISILFLIRTNKFIGHSLKDFYVNVGYEKYQFKRLFKDFYHVDIPYDSLNMPGKAAGIYLMYEDENGFLFKKKFLSRTGPHNKTEDHKLFYGKISNYNNHSIFLYETFSGYISLAYREVNYSDSQKEQKKIESAYKKHSEDVKKGRNTPSILIFEKFCGKYEESARFVFEKLIDDGAENVYFILDKNSPYQSEVPEKYRDYIIEKYSFKHYYEFFNAKAFISTESMNHAIDLMIYNPLTRRRQNRNDYHYFFLQHGVMFAYSIKGRRDFEKGGGFSDNSYVVVSSETEADHFIEDGNFDREDLIKSGLPKYDHAIRNEDADKILIMPTSRNFEYSVIRDDAMNSTYYNFSKRIIESVPEELKSKVVYIAHPLVMNIIGKTDLERYMPKEFSYDKLLRDTRLLITDYSSISYDAFYRGSNVIFAWMEKEMCLERLGIDLKLNDENSFADIAYDYEELGRLISEKYSSSQSEKNIEKYRKIVEFDDNRNTERFIEYIYNTSLFPNKAKEHDINEAEISGIEDKAYTGKPLKEANVKVSFNGMKLIRDIDFTVKSSDNTEIGTAKVDVIGKGIFKGVKSVNYEIKKNIKNCRIEENEGSYIVFDGDKRLKEGADYSIETVDYSGVGIKKFLFKGIGDYIGENEILIDLE